MKLPLILASAVALLSPLSSHVQSIFPHNASATQLAPAPVAPAPPAPGAQAEPAAPATPGASDARDMAGVYQCQGTRPDGTSYQGLVHIVRNNGAYRLLWQFDGEEHYLGIGIVSGNVLAVSYFGGFAGLVVYQLDEAAAAGRLVGQWTVAEANGEVFTETLTRLPANAAVPPLRSLEPRERERERRHQTIVIPRHVRRT